MTRKHFFVASLCFCAFPFAALADSEIDDRGWSFKLMAGVSSEPTYAGSDRYQTEFEYDAEARYTDRFGHSYFLSLGELGADWRLSEQGTLSTVLEYEPGRENADDPILTGFPKVRDTVELQMVYVHEFGPWEAGIGAQYDILDNGKGLVGFVGGAYKFQITERLKGKASLDFSWGNSEYINTEVGISPATSLATGLAAYDASGGYKGATFGIGLEYALSDRVSLAGEISVEHYGDAMAKSPLIANEGDRTTGEAIVGVIFSF